jgi:hypothetical protein
MKNLLVIMCAVTIGCSAESYTIRPNASYEDMSFVISESGYPIIAVRDDVIAHVKHFCAVRDKQYAFIDWQESFEEQHDTDTVNAKFICVKSLWAPKRN